MDESKRYYAYPDYIKKIFGERVRKIPVNAGFTCPTRDGSKGYGGCTYCNNAGFNPFYLTENLSLRQQYEKGKNFFSKKYGDNRFLIYFQAYTNTYAESEYLKLLFDEALGFEGVCGLVIGTRPDCFKLETAEMLSRLSEKTYIHVEFGLESTHNTTLDFIKRGHTYEDSVLAINLANSAGIRIGGHIILYLPGETEAMMLETARRISSLPIETLKLHQLQITKNTVMEKQFRDKPELFYKISAKQYAEFAAIFLENLNPAIAIERFAGESKPSLIVSPNWKGVRSFDITNMINTILMERNSNQGKYY